MGAIAPRSSGRCGGLFDAGVASSIVDGVDRRPRLRISDGLAQLTASTRHGFPWWTSGDGVYHLALGVVPTGTVVDAAVDTGGKPIEAARPLPTLQCSDDRVEWRFDSGSRAGASIVSSSRSAWSTARAALQSASFALASALPFLVLVFVAFGRGAERNRLFRRLALAGIFLALGTTISAAALLIGGEILVIWSGPRPMDT